MKETDKETKGKAVKSPIPKKPEKPKATTRMVVNRSLQRVELPYGDKVIVFIPNKVVEVPDDLNIPKGLNLHVF